MEPQQSKQSDFFPETEDSKMISEEETDDLTDMEILTEIVKKNKMKRQLWKEEE